MEKHLLSKSTFIRGMQCSKSLYLYKHRYFLRDRISPEQLARFSRGTDVGLLAQNLFPDGIDCKPASPRQYAKSLEKTQQIVIEASADVIYEAVFQHHQVLIMLDVLVRENESWNAYEVKSSLKISDTFLLDAALQYYVMKGAGLAIDKFFLVHLNPDYVRNGQLELHQLFVKTDVTDQVLQRQPLIAQKIDALIGVVGLTKSPEVSIGTHCNQPYPCDFIGHCHKNVPVGSVLELTYWSTEEKFALYDSGTLKFSEIKNAAVLNQAQQIELRCRQSGCEYFDKNGLKDFFNKISNAPIFLSLLSHRQAVPAWQGYKPYDLLPLSAGFGGGNENSNFINNATDSPDESFFKFLQPLIASNESVVVFDAARFKELLQRMAVRNSNMLQDTEALAARIIDLKEVFSQILYYNPQVGQDFSLLQLSKLIFGNSHLTNVPFISDTLATSGYLKAAKPMDAATAQKLAAYSQSHQVMTEAFYKYLIEKL
ncbi:MAG: DUF2779 domain-containing protein [Clostridia bacterium]|nr:DUF2779 domain-containing protein [Clostridia bacterium]